MQSPQQPQAPEHEQLYLEVEECTHGHKRSIVMRLIAADADQRLRLPAAPGGARLEAVDLGGLDLNDAELPEAVLRKANLAHAQMDRAKLGGADLAGSVLKGSSLREADLSGALLEDVDLEAANLRFADMRTATLEGANMARADLWGVNLQGAILRKANLEGAVLTEANLTQADFTGACLRDSRLSGADLRGANLRSADLTGSRLKGAQLRAANLSEANLEGLNLTQCDLTHACFASAMLDRTRLTADQLGGAIGEELAGNVHGASHGYLALERNFVSLGDRDGARWAYLKRRRMEKRVAGENARTSWKHGHSAKGVYWLGRFCADQFVELLCNYGESVPRVLASMFVVYAGFLLLYKLTGGVMHFHQGKASQGSWADAALFSLLAMSTSGSSAVGLSMLASLLAGVEGLLGIALTGLLGFVAGNRIRR